MEYAARFQLLVDRSVEKQLRSLPKRDTERILSAIAELAVNPYSGDVAKMQGEEDVWRRRVGSYRIFYEVLTKEKTVQVFRIERRTSKTY